MLTRAVDREVQRCDGGIFGQLREEPLFMQAILQSAERTHSSEAIQFVLAVDELKKAVDGKGPDELAKAKKTVLEDLEAIYTLHLTEAAPEHGNLGVSLEINLSSTDRQKLHAARDEIVAAAATDASALGRISTLFDKQYKTNVGEIKRGLIPHILKSAEYREFLDALYPLPTGTQVAKLEADSSYDDWIAKQKERRSRSSEHSLGSAIDGATASLGSAPTTPTPPASTVTRVAPELQS